MVLFQGGGECNTFVLTLGMYMLNDVNIVII